MAEYKNKKTKALFSAAAVALAASMIIGGGTYAYLQGETNDVVNSFSTNQVLVELAETTGGDYDIIPGTTQAKDPKVTVNATVDAYVYVEVTDKTDGLVDYEIADGWTLLDGYDNVYYREVAADDEAQEFYVLRGNTVSYDAALENSDMVDENGALKDGVELTFRAVAVQAQPFADAASAYAVRDAALVSTAQELQQAVDSGEKALLTNDISAAFTDTSSVDSRISRIFKLKDGSNINLGGNSVTISSQSGRNGIFFSDGTAQISGGSITMDNSAGTSQGTVMCEKAVLILENVTVTAKAGSRYAVVARGNDTTKIILKNCTVNGNVMVGSKALVEAYDTRINGTLNVASQATAVLENSSFTDSQGSGSVINK